MLNAKARSNAKLPISAMWENPKVFFQKVRSRATIRARTTKVTKVHEGI
jgi:hypothetical protein